MGILQLFLQEVKKFSKANWWVFIIYITLLVIAQAISKDDVPQVIAITSLHFIADIFMMMMFSSYSREEYKKGTYFQITSALIFLSLKIYTGFESGHWVYIVADPIYLLAAFKNYQFDVNKRDVKIINLTSMTILSGLILILLPIADFQLNTHQKSSLTLIDWNLLIGLFLFAIALSITGNEKKRYVLSVIGLSIMVMGAFMKTIMSFAAEDIHGLEISYAVLPLTVLVYNLRLWNKIMNNNDNTTTNE